MTFLTTTSSKEWSSTYKIPSTSKYFALVQRKLFADELQLMVSEAEENMFQDSFKKKLSKKELDIIDLKLLQDFNNLQSVTIIANDRFWSKSLRSLDIQSSSEKVLNQRESFKKKKRFFMRSKSYRAQLKKLLQKNVVVSNGGVHFSVLQTVGNGSKKKFKKTSCSNLPVNERYFYQLNHYQQNYFDLSSEWSHFFDNYWWSFLLIAFLLVVNLSLIVYLYK